MKTDKIPVDVLTCDPNHYVQCANMVAAVAALAPPVQDVIDSRVWTLRTAEGYRAFRAFGVRVLPTLCINGQKCFESEVPNLDVLHAALLHLEHHVDRRSAELCRET